MSSNFYDKECKHPIKCFYDPCYRTGDYYKICYLNRDTPDSECFDPEDTLLSVVSRSEGKPIYFIDSLNNELKLTPVKVEKYLKTDKILIYFREEHEDEEDLIYDTHSYLVYGNINRLGSHLVSYSFVSNYKEKDNIINPFSYENVTPWTDEEREIVRIRSTEDPYYKIEEYGR